jgi:hypothetical protein
MSFAIAPTINPIIKVPRRLIIISPYLLILSPYLRISSFFESEIQTGQSLNNRLRQLKTDFAMDRVTSKMGCRQNHVVALACIDHKFQKIWI